MADSGYVAGSGAAAAPTGAFPAGLDYTGLGISTQEMSKAIPLVAGGTQTAAGFAAARGGLAGPGNAPNTPVAAGQNAVTFRDALTAIANYTPDQLESLQQDLYAAKQFSRGYYRKGADDPVTGVPDAPTLRAYVKVLRIAYNTQQPVTDVLNQQKAQHPELGGVTGPEDLAKLTVSLTNPADLAAVAHNATTKNFGRQATPQEIAAFTNAYHQQETQAQVAANDGTLAPSTQAPVASAFADQYFKQQNPTEAGTHSGLDIANSFLQLLQGSGRVPAGSG